MILPTWRECSWRVATQKSNSPLERFIFKYEPTNTEKQEKWRELLTDLIDEDRKDILAKLEEILTGEKSV